MALFNASIATLQQFDCFADPSSIGIRWEKWIKRFKMWVIGMNVTMDARKRALLLTFAGEHVQDVFETLPNTGDDADYDGALAALNAHFMPKRNTEFEVFTFGQAGQLSEETLDAYHTRLRQLSKQCGFHDVDMEIKRHIIKTCRSSRVRQKALRDSMTLAKLLDFGRSIEDADHQCAEMEKMTLDPHHISWVNTRQSTRNKTYKQRRDAPHSQPSAPRPNVQQNRHRARQQPSRSKACHHCGGPYPHTKECPAHGKTCHKCGKMNHFSSVCKSSQSSTRHNPVHHVADNTPDNTHQPVVTQVSSDAKYQYVYMCNSDPPVGCPFAVVDMCDTNVRMMIDTGASLNIISHTAYESLASPPVL